MEPRGSCPMCDGPTGIFYDHRDTWEVCRQCEIGAVVGDGYAVPSGSQTSAAKEAFLSDVAWHRQPPPGATYTQTTFWIDLGHVMDGQAFGWPSRDTIAKIIERHRRIRDDE